MEFVYKNVKKFHINRLRFLEESKIWKPVKNKVLFIGPKHWYHIFSSDCDVIWYSDLYRDVFQQVLEYIDVVVIFPNYRIRTDTYSIFINEIKMIVERSYRMHKRVIVFYENENSWMLFKDNIPYDERYLYIMKIGGDFWNNKEVNGNTFNIPGVISSRLFNPYMSVFDKKIESQYPRIKHIAQNSYTFNKSSLFAESIKYSSRMICLFDYDCYSFIYRLRNDIKDVRYLGRVNYDGYLFLLKKSYSQTFYYDCDIDISIMSQRILENNACYGVSFVLDVTDNFDFERMNVICVKNKFDLIQNIALINRIAEYRENMSHRNWRDAHSYSVYNIFKMLGIIKNDIKISVITPTIRPENINIILKNYYSQKYNNKELVVVINGKNSNSKKWKSIYDISRKDKSVKVISLQGEVMASAALNAGILASDKKSKLVFRVDDDDLYGKNYIYDTVLHYYSTGFDLAGKKFEYVYFDEDNSLYKRKFKNIPSLLFDNKYNNFLNIAGNSFAIDKKFALKHGYLLGALGNADSEFLLSLAYVSPAPKLAYTDNRSLIIVRRAGEDHTWNAGKEFFIKNAEKSSVTIKEIIDV